MSDAQLAFYSAWASIISLFVALISLVYVRGIKTNIVNFRRKQRVRELVDRILNLPEVFTLLLREKTYGPANSEQLSGSYVPEVLIIDNGEVLVSLSDWFVPRADLLGLMRLVDTTTPNVNKLSKLFA